MEGVSEDAGTCSWGHCCWEQQGQQGQRQAPPTQVGFYGSVRAAQTCSFCSSFSFPSLYWFPGAAIRQSTIWVASGQTFISQGS